MPILVAALQLAKERGASILGIVGRDGGYTAKVADVAIVIPTVNPANVTPHSEAFQAVVWHLFVSHPEAKGRRDKMGKHEVAEFKNACVFLDRDGVINRPVVREGRPYPPGTSRRCRTLRLCFGGLPRLKSAGFLLVVVTNQPDVGRGTTESRTADKSMELLLPFRMLDRIETCFHAGEELRRALPLPKTQAGHALSRRQIDENRFERKFCDRGSVA